MSDSVRRVVRFEHERCGDYDGYEYLFAPEDWTNAQILDAVREVNQQMVEDAKAVKDAPLNPPFHPPFTDYPDKTVAEVQALHAEQKVAYAEWREENKHLTRSFSERLCERGFMALWDDESPAYGVRVMWGHHHGLSLEYGPRKGDGFGI